MWGDTTELANQQKIVDAFRALNPTITVKVTVADWDSYWPKLQTDLAGGNAPDVFLMDGPLFADYQTRDQLLDLSPLIARDGFDTTQLADLAVKDFAGADGAPVRAAARPEHDRPLLQQDDVRRGRHPVPGRHLGLGQAGRGRNQADEAGRRPQPVGLLHRDDRHGELLVVPRLAGRRRHPEPRQERRSSSTPTRRPPDIQFLQDLIYKDKVMAQPVPGGTGDAFENGQAAMEANGSWLVPTHEAAGLDFGVAPLPKGPAGQATSVNPSGVVVYKGTKSPDAAWEFVKCYTGPEMQAKIADLKASMPVNMQVLTGQYATSFDGGKTFADALSYAHLKPSFKGYNEFSTALQDELDSKVFNDNQLSAKAALDEITPQLQQLLGQ